MDIRKREANSMKNLLFDAKSKNVKENGFIIKSCGKDNLVEAKNRIDDPEMDIIRFELDNIKFFAFKKDAKLEFDPDTMEKVKSAKQFMKVEEENMIFRNKLSLLIFQDQATPY